MSDHSIRVNPWMLGFGMAVGLTAMSLLLHGYSLLWYVLFYLNRLLGTF